MQGPVSETNSFGSSHRQTNAEYWPHQNGAFIFRIVRLDGPAETTFVERRVATDNAAELGPTAPPNTRPDGQLQVTGLRMEPTQPVVGQPVTITVDATNFSTEPATQTLPVLFVDDGGQQLLATGTFTLAPGTSGTGRVSWLPQHAGSGLLQARDQSVPVTVLGSPPTLSDSLDDVEPLDGSPEESSGE